MGNKRITFGTKKITENTAGESFEKASPVRAFTDKYVLSRFKSPYLVKNPIASKILYVFGIICTLLIPLYVWGVMEFLYFKEVSACISFLQSERGIAAVFSIIALYGIFLVLWLILKKSFVAALAFIIPCFALAAANYFKYALTGDFVYPWDLINQTGNIGELSDFVRIGLPSQYVFALLGGLVFPLLLFFLRTEIRLKILPRWIFAGLLAGVMFMCVSTPQKTEKTLAKFDISIMSTAKQETNHFVNGFTGGFLVNVLSMNVAELEDYSEERINEIMKEYNGKSAENFTSPDVIVILSESFWDPRLLPGTQFSQNPMANFDKIASRENSVSGYMYQTSFGGGTVRTEFEVITGLSTDYIPVGSVPWQYINREIPTYASAFKNLGYKTMFLHTFNSAFYLRDETYPYLGFDEIYFDEDLTKIEEVTPEISGNYISDNSFAAYVEYLLEKENNKPGFIFGITMENHQPYEGKYQSTVIDIANPNMSDESIYALRNYTTGVYFSDMALKRLVDYIDKRDKETILVYFGDHLPNIGADKAAYRESGFISEGEMSDEDWEEILRTPFLIYGNFPLKESVLLKAGGGNLISSYNLINGAAELMGAPKTPYMEFLSDYGKAIPYYNIRLKINPTVNQQKFINSHKLITYDIMHGGKYIEK